VLALWPLLLTLGSAAEQELLSAAVLTPRPQACAHAGGLWERARRADELKHCRLLALAYALLESDPARAKQLASQLSATRLAADALLLLGRAELLLGQASVAWQHLEAARARDVRVFRDVLAQHDAAAVAALSGHFELAAERYQSLVAQRGLLPVARRSRVLIEATMALLRLGPSQVPATLRLLAVLEQSREGHGSWQLEQAVLALVYARAGGSADAAQVLSCEALSIELKQRPQPALLPEPDQWALEALACEGSDPVRAKELWQRYANSPAASPWSDWAKARFPQREP
jgi:hypothetical protein